MAYKYNYESDKSHFLYKIIRPLAKIVVNSRYKITYVGVENVPTDRGIILASNHITAIDPIIIGVGCKVKFHFVAKEELFEKNIVGSITEKSPPSKIFLRFSINAPPRKTLP